MLKKILNYGFVEGISKGLNKLILLVLPFLLDTEDYGKIGLLISIELILPVISLLGLERAVLRFYNEKNSFQFFNKTISIATIFVHLLLLLILLIFHVLGFKTLFSLNLFPDLFFIIILVYFQGSNLITLNMLRVDEKHKAYFKNRLFLQISKFVLAFLLVYITESYLGYLYGAILSAVLTNIFFRIQETRDRLQKFNKRTFISLFIFSWPFIFHGLSGNLLSNADKFIMEKYLSLNEVGLFTFAYSIGSMMVFAFVGISVYMEPLIYKIIDKHEREKLLDKYLTLALFSGLVAYLLISIASIYVLPYFYSENYSEVFNYIPLIAISFVIFPYYLKANYKMIYYKKSFSIALISILSALINILLNIYLIPKYGIYGAVYATFISYMIQSFIFIIVSNKFNLNKEFIEVILLGVVLSILIYYKTLYYISVVPVLIFIVAQYYFKFKTIKA